MRLDALIRVSQKGDRDGAEFRSPRQQREVCDHRAELNGDVIVTQHESIDVSGRTMVRRDVDAALERIRAGKTDGVIVAWLDRFSRAPVDEALRVYRDIREAGGHVVACDMAGLNPDDPTGEMALTVMLAVGRQGWRQRAARWDQSRGDAIRDGKAIGGAPFGYRYRDPTPRPRGKGVLDSHLVVHDREAKIVRELFERKIGGATWLELARWLDATAPKPDRFWSRTTVSGMVSSRTYLGEARHGKHVNPDAHPPIVTPALWRRAQNAPGRRTPRGNYLLTGLVRCAGCGRRMRGTSGGRGSKPPTYVCTTAECEERYSTVTVDRLDTEVVDQFFAHLDAFHVRVADDSELSAAREGVEQVTGEVERLAAVAPSHPAAVRSHQAALEDAEQRLAEAEDRLHHLVASQVGGHERDLRGDWPSLTLEERRTILRAGVDAVLVRRASSRTARPPVRERLLVLFRGEAPPGLADNGRSASVTAWTWDDEPSTLVAAA